MRYRYDEDEEYRKPDPRVRKYGWGIYEESLLSNAPDTCIWETFHSLSDARRHRDELNSLSDGTFIYSVGRFRNTTGRPG